MPPIQRLALVVNPSKEGALELARRLTALAERRRVRCETLQAYPLPAAHLRDFDLCVVIGGDGTILGVAEAAAEDGVPVLGVNLGSLGFMALVRAEAAEATLEQVLRGDYAIERRSLLEVRNARAERRLALNDVVVKASASHLLKLEVRAEGRLINAYSADGLIVATPTGSTAYNLSAGGPIIHPGARVMVLTPINPHTLSNRAVVLDESQRVSISLRACQSGISVALDGREAFARGDELPLEVGICAALSFPLVHTGDYWHFDVLRQKLRWAGHPLGD